MGNCFYKILPEKKLILRRFVGILTMDDIFQCIKNSLTDEAYDPEFSAIYDIRDVNHNIDKNAISKFTKDIWETKEIISKRTVVFITDSPSQVVLSTLLQTLRQTTFFRIVTVSTVEAAIRTLNIPKEEMKEIENALRSLK